MSGGAGFLVRYWKAVATLALGGVLVLVIGTFTMQRNVACREAASEAHTIEAHRQQIGQLQSSVVQLQQAIDRKNTAVSRLTDEAARRPQAATSA
ncbi:hypothetical protein WT08_28180 [Burkholderia sp. MSMB1552]|nr:hypothetical protein WT08_28180 [Burkholderia sp. MSMB1552]